MKYTQRQHAMAAATVSVMVMAGCTAFASHAEESPATRHDFMAKAQEVAGFLSIHQTCGIAGYRIAPTAIEATIVPLTDKAMTDGMPEQEALKLMQTEVEKAVAGEKAIAKGWIVKISTASEAGDDDAVNVALNGWFDYINDRCATLSRSPVFGIYITAPVDPDNKAGFDSFVTWLDANVSEAAPAH